MEVFGAGSMYVILIFNQTWSVWHEFTLKARKAQLQHLRGCKTVQWSVADLSKNLHSIVMYTVHWFDELQCSRRKHLLLSKFQRCFNIHSIYEYPTVYTFPITDLIGFDTQSVKCISTDKSQLEITDFPIICSLTDYYFVDIIQAIATTVNKDKFKNVKRGKVMRRFSVFWMNQFVSLMN